MVGARRGVGTPLTSVGVVSAREVGAGTTVGPIARRQLDRLALTWPQGAHVLVTGGTGSGKSLLTRHLDQIRIDRGGYVVVFVSKLQTDETFRRAYRGWTRWKTWHTHPRPSENRILLWPAVEKKTPTEAIAIMAREFKKALDEIGRSGRWTVHIDEGLLVTSPQYIGLAAELGAMSALIRSAHGTLIILAQRPAHLPLVLYSNVTHVFAARASESADVKRLAEIDGPHSSRDIRDRILSLQNHDFLHISAGQSTEPEVINLAR